MVGGSNLHNIKRDKYLLFMLSFGMIIALLFQYLPMPGIMIAFKDFSLRKGILGSDWVGLKNFYTIFGMEGFRNSFVNTLIIFFMRIVFGFPAPIILAVIIYELRFNRFKKAVQTVLTFPHFLSWVILSGVFFNILKDAGIVNIFLVALGFSKQQILSDAEQFRWFLIFSDIWKEAGWGTILYLASMASIDVQLYEAAELDGASRLQKIFYITIPCIKGTIVILFILSFGSVLSGGFDQIINLSNPVVYSKSEVLDTYIYNWTFKGNGSFDTGAAIGIFKSVVGLVMLITVNKVIRKITNGERGLM